MQFRHRTVLCEEAVAFLAPGADKVIVDGTLGGGGHAEALLRAGAAVIGIDRDPRALAAAEGRLADFSHRFTAVQGNFGDLEQLVRELRHEVVDGVLLDLGVSSPQLDDPGRGFSFQKDGPLDMRMGQDGKTAADLIAESDEKTLTRVLYEYGEESFAPRIARALIQDKPETTLAAVACVERAVPRKAWPRHIHVATRTFQALRIWVNGELEALDRALEALPRVLRKGGRAAIISFHSLEDRRVKDGFRALEGGCTCPRDFPVCVCQAKGGFKVLTKKPVLASEPEATANPRARSAKLRAVERER